jgi:glycosyltransferase involved in cell wall biosynthesis
LESAGVEAGRPREIATYEAADAVIAITEDDRRTLETLPGIKCIYTIPNIVPLQSRSLRNRQKELLFVGIFNHAPNPDGLLWFVHCVWPKVRARVNDAILTVIGRFAPAEIQALDGKDGISILGYVPETASYLDRAAISIAPLRFGAGMKGKVTEALASGVPVVTTTIGAQGFGIVSGVHALVANDPENFAANIVQLLNDEVYATKIGCAGRELVAELCSPEKVASQLNSMVAELLPSRRPQVPLRWWREAFFVRFRRLAYAMLKQVGISSSSRPTTQFSE